MATPYLPQVGSQQSMANPSISDILKPINPYQAGLLLLLAVYAPSTGWHSTFPPLEILLQGLFFLGLLFLGCTTSKTSLSALLRYGHHQHGQNFLRIAKLWQGLPSWAPYIAVAVLVLFPMSRVWLIGAVPIAWQYNLHNYRKEARGVKDRVDGYCSRAAMIAKNARENAITAERYEQQALDTATIAVRDARLAKTIQATDFFDKAVEAWTALHKTAESAKDAASAARDAFGDAKRVYDLETPRGDPRTASLAEALFERARVAYNSTEDAAQKAKTAEVSTVASENAFSLVTTSRRKEEENSTAVVRAAGSLTSWAGKAAPAAFNAAAEAENVRACALKAKAAAADGNMDAASSLADDAEDALKKVIESQKQVTSAKDEARKIFVNLLLGKYQ